ncbi:MAG: hypothetical protein ACFE0I_03735 [Elainellaceae cyanobacterium]
MTVIAVAVELDDRVVHKLHFNGSAKAANFSDFHGNAPLCDRPI